LITKRRLLVNSTSGLVSRILNLLVQIWLYQYLIKRISAAEYSLYPVVNALLIFVPPMTVILIAGLSRDVVEAHARNDERRITEIASTMFPVLLAAGIGLAACGVFAARYLGDILKIAPENVSEGRLMVLLLFGSLSLRLILTPFGLGLYACQKFVLSNSLNTSQTVLRAVLLFVLLLGVGPRVLWVVVASVAADLVFQFINTIASIRALPALRFRFDCVRWELLSGLMAFGMWNTIGSIAMTIRQSSDLLILNRFATPVDVNAFQLGSLPDTQIDAALLKLKEPLEPYMIAAHAVGGPAALRNTVARGGRYAMWAACLVAVPLIVFRHEVWSIYLGSKLAVYADVPIVMLLLMARYWIEGPISMVGMAAYAMKRVRKLAMITLVASFANIVATVYFVCFLREGAVGSALGTALSVVMFIPAYVKFNRELLGATVKGMVKATYWRGSLPSVVAGLFALGWRRWMQPHSIPDLLLAAAAVASVYVASLLLFCLDKDEQRKLKQLSSNLSSLRTFKARVSPE
jgi:O-antigen/teichoic acid export membrane protein